MLERRLVESCYLGDAVNGIRLSFFFDEVRSQEIRNDLTRAPFRTPGV